MATDALLAALKSIADENGLTRIDIGYSAGVVPEHAAHTTIWFDGNDPGCLTAFRSTFDEAIDCALAEKAGKLAPIAVAA